MIDIKLPSLGEGVEKGIVVAILVKEGDKVVPDQPLLEVETDKVTAEVPSEYAGVVTSVLVAIGDEVPEGAVIVKMEVESDTTTAKEPEVEKPAEIKEEKQEDPKEIVVAPVVIAPEKIEPVISAENSSGKKFRASPLARKVAREIGVDIIKVSAVDNGSRVSVLDVKNFAKHQLSKQNNGFITAPVTLPDFSKYGAVNRVVMSGIAKATSRNMSQSWSQIPHAWLQEKADITILEKTRKSLKGEVKEQGGSLTITILIVKAICKALEKYPLFNASIDTASNELIYKDYINIGVAVDTDRGLVVPVIKNVTHKSLTTLSIELTELSFKAREGKLKVDDLSGATFTISNLGGIGTTGIFPIVNFPQAAILGVAASSIESVWVEDTFEPRLMMPMTIGFDHRIINGADAARFLVYIKHILETGFMASL